MPLVLELNADKLQHSTPITSLEEYWVNNNNIYLSIYSTHALYLIEEYLLPEGGAEGGYLYIYLSIYSTHALYLIEGYSPRVEQRVAICSAIFSMPALFSDALK